MEWSGMYDQNSQPAMESIKAFIKSDLWNELCSYLESTYSISPKIEYSKCSMQKGWNVKYKKGGKSLCTLYPMDGWFIALVVICEKEQTDAELLMPAYSVYVQRLFHETIFSAGGRWLMIEVRERAVLEDVQKLVQIRSKHK